MTVSIHSNSRIFGLLDGRKRFRYNYASVRCKSLLGFCVGGAFANIAPECERDEVSGWKRLSHRRDRCGRERHIQAFIGSPRLALSRSRASNTRGAILGDSPSDEVQDMAQQIASGHASVHFGPFQNEEEVNRVHWRDFDTLQIPRTRRSPICACWPRSKNGWRSFAKSIASSQIATASITPSNQIELPSTGKGVGGYHARKIQRRWDKL